MSPASRVLCWSWSLAWEADPLRECLARTGTMRSQAFLLGLPVRSLSKPSTNPKPRPLAIQRRGATRATRAASRCRRFSAWLHESATAMLRLPDLLKYRIVSYCIVFPAPGVPEPFLQQNLALTRPGCFSCCSLARVCDSLASQRRLRSVPIIGQLDIC